MTTQLFVCNGFWILLDQLSVSHVSNDQLFMVVSTTNEELMLLRLSLTDSLPYQLYCADSLGISLVASKCQ